MVTEMKKEISISVKRDTHHELSKLGSKDESYDSIIRRLLKAHGGELKSEKKVIEVSA